MVLTLITNKLNVYQVNSIYQVGKFSLDKRKKISTSPNRVGNNKRKANSSRASRPSANSSQTDKHLSQHNSATFAEILLPRIPKSSGSEANLRQVTPLILLDYQEELALKNKALSLFWQHHHLASRPDPLIASPLPRAYRTTSKRKTVLHGSKLHLIFGSRLSKANISHPLLESPAEPIEHGRIYKFLQKRLSEPSFKLVAGHLNYIIIRGNYSERVVIFNLDTLNGPLVHKFKIIAKDLQALPEKIVAAFLYPDPSCSDYYLESRRPADLMHFKRLYGKTNLTVKVKGCRFNFHPTSFSQVNESMTPVMLDTVHELLKNGTSKRLLDLYCGYGLFSLFLAPDYQEVIGIEAEGMSIKSAISNSKLNPDSRHTRFKAYRITSNLDSILPSSITPETIILDPPRQGPQKGVINSLGQRHPEQVLHIFCGVDQIPTALKEWEQCGYVTEQVVPLDMFPGSANLEILILLKPAALVKS